LQRFTAVFLQRPRISLKELIQEKWKFKSKTDTHTHTHTHTHIRSKPDLHTYARACVYKCERERGDEREIDR
jgi:hypothetical protein